MVRPRFVLFASWLATTLVVGGAIFSTPYMRGVLLGERVESAVESLSALLVFAALCGWPWMRLAWLPPSDPNRNRQYSFSVISLVIAIVFFPAISGGKDFAIGLYTIFCVLGIWIAYVLTGVGTSTKGAMSTESDIASALESALVSYRSDRGVFADCPTCHSPIRVVPNAVQRKAGVIRVAVQCDCGRCNGQYDLLKESRK